MEAGRVSGIHSEVWLKLAGSSPSGESLTARFAIPTVTERLLAAIDSDGRRHLLVPLKPGNEELRDAQSRGVSVATRELTVRDRGTARYLDFECHDAAGHEAFDLIGGELAEGLKSEGAKPAVLAARVLAKWRRFWGQSPWQILLREEQLGLFAELWFLSVWLIPRAGISKSLTGWRGPLGARHDFEWAGKSVEVKATTSTRGRVHRINGLDQLAPPENGALMFFSLRLREEGGASNTLPGLVASCRSLLEADAEALNRFESALAQVGYSPAHEEEYARVKLRIADEGLFRVQENFPRLTQASFASGVPAGVERVEYEINLAGFDHLRIAAKPEEFVFE
jgi:hypothetical protein